jgi:ubiquinone/menaquinone biosynthesis C-methylase UbiE
VDDREALKQRLRQQWDELADRWDRWTPVLRDQLAPATELMLDLARLRPGHRVLDIASGNGYQSIAAARRVGPSGRVLATDLAPEQVKRAAAAARKARIGHIDTRVMDAENLDVPDASFDAVICHLGVILLPDLDRGLREMHRVLKPSGWVSVVIFAAGGVPESELASSIVRDRVSETEMPERETGVTLGAPGVLEGKFLDVGFQSVESHEMAVPLRLPSAADAGRYLRETHPRLEEMMAPLTHDQRDDVWRRIEQGLARYVGPDGFESPNRVIVVAGQRASDTTLP